LIDTHGIIIQMGLIIVNNNNPKSTPQPPPDVDNNPSTAIAYRRDRMSPTRSVIKEWGILSEKRGFIMCLGGLKREVKVPVKAR